MNLLKGVLVTILVGAAFITSLGIIIHTAWRLFLLGWGLA